jgi:hypothetical protein
MKVKSLLACVISVLCVSSTFLVLPASADVTNAKEYTTWTESVLADYDIGFSISSDNTKIATDDDGSSYVTVSFVAEKITEDLKYGGACNASLVADGISITETGIVGTNTIKATSIECPFAKLTAGTSLVDLKLQASDGTADGVYEIYFNIDYVNSAPVIEDNGESIPSGETEVTEQSAPYTNSIWLTVSDGNITDVSMKEPENVTTSTSPVSTTTTPVTTTTTVSSTTTTPVGSTTTTPVSSTTTPVTTTTTSKSVSSSSSSSSTSPVSGTTTVSGSTGSDGLVTITTSYISLATGDGNDETDKENNKGSNNNNNNNNNSSDGKGNSGSSTTSPGTSDSGVGSLIALLGVSIASAIAIKKQK